jgi:hypothetical protein
VFAGCSSGTQGSGETPAPGADEFEEQTLDEPELQLESPPPSTLGARRGGPAFQSLSAEMTPPVRVVQVAPSYPERGAPCRASSRVWIGEIDIDETGDVAEVRTIQPIRCDPPWPEWEEAIPAAIRQWKYEPAAREGRPVPVVITVRISVGEAGDEE